MGIAVPSAARRTESTGSRIDLSFLSDCGRIEGALSPSLSATLGTLGGLNSIGRESVDSTVSQQALTGAVLSELASSALELLQNENGVDEMSLPPLLPAHSCSGGGSVSGGGKSMQSFEEMLSYASGVPRRGIEARPWPMGSVALASDAALPRSATPS